MNDSISFRVEPGGSLRGEGRVAGDKSISHRAVMLGAIAEGTTRVMGFLQAEDCLATMDAFRAMGVPIEIVESGGLVIQGVGSYGLKAPERALYLGNSGTSLRLLSGLLAGQTFDTVLTGDASLTRRPMRRVAEPLTMMGAKVMTTENGTAPLHIAGGQQLQGIRYAMPVVSAQIKSCLLLAGLYARGETCIIESAPTRDHTERMLERFSCPIQRVNNRIRLHPGKRLLGTDVDVPGDLSSAAFFLVGASIGRDSDVTLRHVGINPTRTGVIEILRLMGADIELLNPRTAGGEPVADLRVKSSRLRGICIPETLVPLAIDEFPVLFIAAACAEGETRLSGAAELRVKESDRIQVMADGLQALGIDADPVADGMIIQGGRIGGGIVDSHGDHRIAMAFAIAALRAGETIEIKDCENVNTSFPTFVELANRFGLRLRVFRTSGA
jgi:3-phosphoshikimate 1-carboxyvinyltransferase